MSDNESNMIL